MEVDLLTFQSEENAHGDHYQTIQGVDALKIRGGELAFEGAAKQIIEGELPDGTKTSVPVYVASTVPFLILKSLALFDRRSRKDAYDIYHRLKNYPEGLDDLAREFQAFLHHDLVKEGLQRLDMCFSSVNSEGPRFVADFMETVDVEERRRLQRDSYEHVNYLLEELGLRGSRDEEKEL